VKSTINEFFRQKTLNEEKAQEDFSYRDSYDEVMDNLFVDASINSENQYKLFLEVKRDNLDTTPVKLERTGSAHKAKDLDLDRLPTPPPSLSKNLSDYHLN
jgi:hypothetical protein